MIHYIDCKQLSSELINCKKNIIAFFTIKDSIPCKMQNDILAEIEKEYHDYVEVFKIDALESMEPSIIYKVFSYPTMIFYKDGIELERKTGLVQKEEIVTIIKE